MAKITIIDDDLEILEHTIAVLRKDGHEVTTLDTTINAVQILREDTPDVLILDVMFPENPVAGFALARQLRRCKATKDLPILLLTGMNQEFPMDFSAADIDPDWMPVQAFVEKPVSPKVLTEKIRKLLEAKG